MHVRRTREGKKYNKPVSESRPRGRCRRVCRPPIPTTPIVLCFSVYCYASIYIVCLRVVHDLDVLVGAVRLDEDLAERRLFVVALGHPERAARIEEAASGQCAGGRDFGELDHLNMCLCCDAGRTDSRNCPLYKPRLCVLGGVTGGPTWSSGAPSGDCDRSVKERAQTGEDRGETAKKV